MLPFKHATVFMSLSALCVIAGFGYTAEAATPPLQLLQTLSLPGILNADGSSNFFIPPASENQQPPFNRFALVLWQSNPFQANHLTSPVTWDAGTKTGLFVRDPSTEQSGFNPNSKPTSTVQISGAAVGAYMNSKEVVGQNAPGDNDGKFMITPEFRLAPNPGLNGALSQEQIFQYPMSSLQVIVNLQVPTAVDPGSSKCITYVNMDNLFQQVGRTSNKVTVNVGLFFDHHAWKSGDPLYSVNQDPDTGNYMLGVPLESEASDYVTIGRGSSTQQGRPWSGYQQFAYVISSQNFQHDLVKMAEKYPISVNPSDYVLTEVHLNAEMQDAGEGCNNPTSPPLELGWSMRDMNINWISQ